MDKKFKMITLAVIAVLFVSAFAVVTYTANYYTYESSFLAQSQDVLVLKQGSRGDTVRKIQQRLKNWGYYKGSVDGIYGSQTRRAVISFQRKNGLVADGIAGNKTLQAIGISVSASNSSSQSGKYSSSDIALLARLIYAEARGESYTGQVAVGAVVLNRVKSSSFPNTISGVIY